MALAISNEILATIYTHIATSPDEVCGLLFGSVQRIVEAVPAANVAADPSIRFEIDPAVLLQAHRMGRTTGQRVVGHYHSHPSGLAQPSATDAAMALEEGVLWLIAAAGEVTAWMSVAGGSVEGRFEPVPLIVED